MRGGYVFQRLVPVVLLPALLLPLLHGCVQVSAEGDSITYSNPPWMVATLILLSLVAIPVGWRLRRAPWPSRRVILGYFVLACCPVTLILFVPRLYLDRIVVRTDRLEARESGWWWSAQHHVLKFDELRELRWVRHEARARSTESFVILFVRKDGETTEMPFNELMQEAYPVLRERAAGYHVRVADADAPADFKQ